MLKKPFVTKEKILEISEKFPTPFYIYDEKGIRENAEKVKKAFSWNKGFREYFAVKANPNPFILSILKEYDCGTDCSSLTELQLSHALNFDGSHTMFSSNDTPFEEYTLFDTSSTMASIVPSFTISTVNSKKSPGFVKLIV